MPPPDVATLAGVVSGIIVRFVLIAAGV